MWIHRNDEEEIQEEYNESQSVSIVHMHEKNHEQQYDHLAGEAN